MRLYIHATLVEIHSHGILLTGKPGIGKSHLAFELIQKGHKLIADDGVILINRNNSITGFSPKKLRGWLRVGEKDYFSNEIGSQNILRTTPICLICHLVESKSLLQYLYKTPTINSQLLLGKLIPEVILPKYPLAKMSKKLENIVRKHEKAKHITFF